MKTGLTILDRLPKKKKNTLKVTKLTSCMDFRMIQAVIKCCERSTVERIRHGVFVIGHPPNPCGIVTERIFFKISKMRKGIDKTYLILHGWESREEKN